MRYFLASQTYWPIWITVREAGYPWLSILVAGVFVLGLVSVLWKLEFNEWSWWK